MVLQAPGVCPFVCTSSLVMAVGSAGCYNKHCQSHLNVGCWNVRSLVEAEEPVTTASTRRGVSVDR